jgi:hypothetical protein
MKPSPFTLAFPIGLALVAACGVEPLTDDTGGETCEEGKCDGLPFLDQLKGKEDPVAKWLRGLGEAGIIDDQGVYHADKAGSIAPTEDANFYGKLIEGLITVQGCGKESLINYAISDDLITGNQDQIYPRLISTVCSDTEQVTNAFIATLGEPLPDINVNDLEFFAWDATAQKYFFYDTKDIGDGNLQIEVDPARCVKCHTTPLDVPNVGMPRLPIMNELTKPWTHWEAGSGGVSDSFLVPESLAGMPNWERYGGGKIGAASRLEKVMRDANALRVTPARSKHLFRPAKLDEAMGLIRPLFCDEQVNYASELATGEMPVDAFVSPGTKGAFRAINATWGFAWFNNDIVQLPSTTEDKRLFMVPVRGIADVTFEAQLHGVLSPNHILALRALDWKKPAFSEMRCNLWRDALTKFTEDADSAPKLSGRNRDAVKVLFDEIMKLGGMSTRGLASGKFVALDVATTDSIAALEAAVAAGNVPTSCSSSAFCEVDAAGFGGLLETYVTSIEQPAARDALIAERDRRVCYVMSEVEPAQGHETHGPGTRVANDPSFVKLENGTARDTIPFNCP